jgi:hypothetical protein
MPVDNEDLEAYRLDSLRIATLLAADVIYATRAGHKYPAPLQAVIDLIDTTLHTPIAILPDSNNDAASTIASGVRRVVVAAVTSDANDWLVLPAGTAGAHVRGWSVVAHEIRTPATSNATINGQDGDGTKEAAIPATTLWEADCVATDTWVLRAWDELGAPITAIVPD